MKWWLQRYAYLQNILLFSSKYIALNLFTLLKVDFWFLTAKMLISFETSEIHLKVVPQLEKLYDVLVILSVWSFKNYLSIVYFTLLSQQEARANIHTPTHKKSCKYKKEYVMSDIDIEQSWRKYMNYVKLQNIPKEKLIFMFASNSRIL